MNYRKELIRIKGFVNKQYFNKSSVKLTVKANGDNSFNFNGVISLTLWRKNAAGNYTVPYSKYLKVADVERLHWIDVDVELSQDYEGRKQGVIRTWLDETVYSPEKFAQRQAENKKRLEEKGYEFKEDHVDMFRDDVKQPQPETTIKTVEADNGTIIEVPVDDLPWELDL